jgi:hypothetical protein
VRGGQDDGERAKELFARASELAPARADLRAAADRLARIASAEQGFVTLEVGPFKIQHAKSREAARGVASREAIGFVQNVLRLAHADLERELGGAPKGPICVQLYDAEQYAKVQENPLAVAFYDGKLRVPLGEWPAGKPELEGNLRHELAHAFLHGLFPKVPRWLHEGLCAAPRAAQPRGRAGAAADQGALAAGRALRERVRDDARRGPDAPRLRPGADRGRLARQGPAAAARALRGVRDPWRSTRRGRSTGSTAARSRSWSKGRAARGNRRPLRDTAGRSESHDEHCSTVVVRAARAAPPGRAKSASRTPSALR